MKNQEDQLQIWQDNITERIAISNKIAFDKAKLAQLNGEFKEAMQKLSQGKDMDVQIGPYKLKLKWIHRKGFSVEDCDYMRIFFRK